MRFDNSHNHSFFTECTKDLQHDDTILWVGFARRNAQEREETFIRDTELILSHTDKDLTVLSADEESLLDQIAQAQLVFVTGGDTEKLQAAIECHPDFMQALEGKVYAGSSAGACICATYYYGEPTKEVVQGMQLLPIALQVHADNPDFGGTPENTQKLAATAPDLELIALPESEWVVRQR